MKLTWYGHSCFMLESSAGSVVFDPYAPGYVPGLRDLDITANAYFTSHGHGDHNYSKAVTVTGNSHFEVESILCPHDDCGGKKRGMNTVTIVHIGGMRVAHMGDIGCTLPEKDMEKLRGVDVMLIPVGGYYTIDASAADAIARATEARVVIPMHYRTEKAGFDVIAPVEDFLKMRDNVVLCGETFEVTPDTPNCTAVLQQAMIG